MIRPQLNSSISVAVQRALPRISSDLSRPSEYVPKTSVSCALPRILSRVSALWVSSAVKASIAKPLNTTSATRYVFELHGCKFKASHSATAASGVKYTLRMGNSQEESGGGYVNNSIGVEDGGSKSREGG